MKKFKIKLEFLHNTTPVKHFGYMKVPPRRYVHNWCFDTFVYGTGLFLLIMQGYFICTGAITKNYTIALMLEKKKPWLIKPNKGMSLHKLYA